MYNSFNNELENNKMLTPPTIGLTSSIVNNKLNDMLLEINSKINDARKSSDSHFTSIDFLSIWLVYTISNVNEGFWFLSLKDNKNS